MKRFSAQYIITGTGSILKRGIVTCNDDGLILSVTDTGGNLTELDNTEFYNGIIVPGFINCHCHLELSGLKNMIPEHGGLGSFIDHVMKLRDINPEIREREIKNADREMYNSGIVACADICNTNDTFIIKDKSQVKYINLLEVFGSDPAKVHDKIAEIRNLAKEASQHSSPSYIVPHSVYSLSLPLLDSVKELTDENVVTSVHFMESAEEKEFIDDASGNIAASYHSAGIRYGSRPERVKDHVSAVLNNITASGNLILVHSTFAGRNDIKKVMERHNTYWCICQSSNRFIENHDSPVEMLQTEGAEIVIGTDSLASNKSLSIVEEIKLIEEANRRISLAEIIKWATINGARALGISDQYGSIEQDKRPGLVLLENVSLEEMRLTSGTRARRLI